MRATPGFLSEAVVLIPALNEAESVASTVRAWLALGAKRARVIDNGSVDGTAEIARQAGAEVVFESTRGYGAAVWQGLQSWPEDCPWVLFSSADGSDRLSADDLTAWQRAAEEGADLVLGDRTATALGRAELKWAQRLGNALCCWALARGWGRRFRDMASLRLIRRSALDRLRLRDRGFGWNLEMQARAVELGLRIVELPVRYYPRAAGQSKISGTWLGTIRAGRGILRALWQLRKLAKERDARLAEAVATRMS